MWTCPGLVEGELLAVFTGRSRSGEADIGGDTRRPGGTDIAPPLPIGEPGANAAPIFPGRGRGGLLVPLFVPMGES